MAIPVKRRLPLVACLLPGAALAAEPPATPSAPVPSFAQLEARGARIGTVTVESQNIFDLDDPSENNSLFRLANAVHVRTRPEVIRRLLLFKTGDPLTVQAIDETERIMRANHFIYDVVISPVSIHDGIVDIGITTRDTWSLDRDAMRARRHQHHSRDLATTSLARDGSGSQTWTSSPRHRIHRELWPGIDGWTSLSSRRLATATAIARRWSPALSTPRTPGRRGAGIGGTARVDLQRGDTTASVIGGSARFSGWSPGLVRGWAQRISSGATLQDHSHETQPGEKPWPLPLDHSRADSLRTRSSDNS
jgi:hypothetical protein